MSGRTVFTFKKKSGSAAPHAAPAVEPLAPVRTTSPPSLDPHGASPLPGAAEGEEADPLDSYMSSLEAQLVAGPPQPGQGGGGEVLEAEESGEGFVAEGGEGEEGEGEGEGGRNDPTAGLSLIDHAAWVYPPLVRTLAGGGEAGREEEALAAAGRVGVAVVVDGPRPPALPLPSPLRTFAGAWDDDPPPAVLPLLRAMARAGWAAPTPVQAVALPALLRGWDVLALAPTGSGKTVAYGLPAVLHAVAHAASPHPRPRSGEGGERDRGLPSPAALVLLPTRELAVQVGGVLRTLAGGAGTSCVLLIGGAGKFEQGQELRRGGGPGCVVATPGRLLEHVRDASLSLARTSFLVLDEADRLLDMGFEGQVKAVAAAVRPDVRVALISATWSTRVADLASTVLGGRTGVLRVQVGDGRSPPAIVQALVAVEPGPPRWEWLAAHLPAALAAADRVAATSPGPPPPAKALLFVASQAGAEALCASLNGCPPLRAALGVPPSARLARALHGGLSQADRTAALVAFTTGSVPLLVATDVAARGLDVEGVTLVLCYDGARSAETHTHRIGRTGRAGRPGLAVSLLRAADAHLLPSLPQEGGEAEGGSQPLPPAAWPTTGHYIDPRLSRAGGGRQRGRGEPPPAFLQPPPRGGGVAPARPVLAGFVAAASAVAQPPSGGGGGEGDGEPALKRSRWGPEDGSRPGLGRHLPDGGVKD